jgi:hypothetical protein
MTFYNLRRRNTLSSQTSRPTTPNPSDEAAIRALYEQLMGGWNSGDGNAFAAPFADDADFVAFDRTSHLYLAPFWLSYYATA